MVQPEQLECQGKSEGKMAKSPEVADRIYDLRSKRRETQTQFAEAVGVTQQSISDWESKTTDAVPSSDSYLRLGTLAPYPDNLWFWGQAGLDQEAMLSAAEKLLHERGKEPPKGKTVAVPRLVAMGETTEKSELRLWDAKDIPKPGSVAYFEVLPAHHGIARPPIHRPGTIILLDTSGASATDLQPFWRKVVLVETTDEIQKLKFSFPNPSGPGIGLRIGRLYCASAGMGEHSRWHAILHDPDLPCMDVSFNQLNMESFGEWAVSMTTDKWRLKTGDSFDMRLLRARAEEELRLYRGCQILGRVLDWYRPPQEKGRKG
jgi:transcriptional regulator with XRE-family HTH domain